MRSLAFCVLLSFIFSPPVVGAENHYLADLVGGLTLRSGSGSQFQLDTPGPGLRLDFGRELGVGFSLLGTLGWSRLGGSSNTPCPDCLKTDDANTLVLGMGVRYNIPVPVVELFLQTGAGYLLDILDQSGGTSGQSQVGLSRQAVFTASLGIGVAVSGSFTVGGRFDSLIGADLDVVTFAGYAGVRY